MNWEKPLIEQPIIEEIKPVPPEPFVSQQMPRYQDRAPSAAPNCKLQGFGYFFNETVSVYKRNLWKFLTLSAIPVLALSFFPKLLSEAKSGSFAFLLFIYFTIIIISLWANLSLLYAIKERDNGITLGGALQKGGANLLSFIWIYFLLFLITFAGFLLFIVPGILFTIWFSLSIYVLVNENKKGMSALRRSKELISGYFTAFWGRTMLFFLIFVFIAYVLFFIITLFSSFSPVLRHLSIAINIILASLPAIFGFLVYENIKKAKDSGCKKSPKEIKYVLVFLSLILLFILAMITIILLNSIF